MKIVVITKKISELEVVPKIKNKDINVNLCVGFEKLNFGNVIDANLLLMSEITLNELNLMNIRTLREINSNMKIIYFTKENKKSSEIIKISKIIDHLEFKINLSDYIKNLYSMDLKPKIA